jgi:hypothetical protein
VTRVRSPARPRECSPAGDAVRLSSSADCATVDDTTAVVSAPMQHALRGRSAVVSSIARVRRGGAMGLRLPDVIARPNGTLPAPEKFPSWIRVPRWTQLSESLIPDLGPPRNGQRRLSTMHNPPRNQLPKSVSTRPSPAPSAESSAAAASGLPSSQPRDDEGDDAKRRGDLDGHRMSSTPRSPNGCR